MPPKRATKNNQRNKSIENIDSIKEGRARSSSRRASRRNSIREARILGSKSKSPDQRHDSNRAIKKKVQVGKKKSRSSSKLSNSQKRNEVEETNLDNFNSNEDDWSDLDQEEENKTNENHDDNKDENETQNDSKNQKKQEKINSVFNSSDYAPWIRKSSKGPKYFTCMWCKKDAQIKNIRGDNGHLKTLQHQRYQKVFCQMSR